MRKQQPTPVDTGTQSTEADAVHVAGKAVARKGFGRGADLVVKLNTRLTTRLIEAGHQAFLALEKPGHDVDLAAVKARWISGVQELIAARFKAGSGYPVIDGINFQKFYGATSAKTKDEIKIEKLEAKLAKLKAKVRSK
jgi:hypothetical protein